MEITKEDFELFLQFKQFMGTKDNIELSPIPQKKTRRDKGSGSIIKLSGTRKRPFLVSVTTGYDKYTGKQQQTPLAYVSERKYAEKVLDIYLLETNGKCDKNTTLDYIYSVDGRVAKKGNLIEVDESVISKLDDRVRVSKCPTFEEIWKKVYANDLSHLSDRALINYRVSFRHFEKLHKRKIDSITLHELQPYFDELMEKGTGQSKMNNMKIVLNYIFKYAIKYDYIEKNYAQYISFKETLNKDDKKYKVPFTKEQIKDLFKHDENPIVQTILIMIYTGMRPSELLKLKKENVHIDERYMIGGLKTKNGIDRVIPIHECIVQYVEKFFDNKIPKHYQYYLLKFNEIKEQYQFQCTPHSGRHTFATLANEYELNEFLIKKIMGHSSRDLTKDVYTHVETKRLIDEINKIPTLNE